MQMSRPHGFGVLWHSSMSMHLPPELGSKPRGQFVRELIGADVVVVVVVVIIVVLGLMVTIVGVVRDCGT